MLIIIVLSFIFNNFQFLNFFCKSFIPMSIDPLKGKVFVFTGDMNMPREEAQNKIMILGARFTTAVSSKTTYLVSK